ncbi:MAG: arginine--tRNA ligase [Candidatus Taylorbacteria bacterium]|nr:arginine--tRNA ligase [Candidatus Taylorbacteria bacterium]
MFAEKLKKAIAVAVAELGLAEAKVALDHPTEMAMGDYSCNIALSLAKQAGEKPRDLAEKIIEKIKGKLVDEIEKVEAAGPGFINFYLSKKFLENSVIDITKRGEGFGRGQGLSGEKIIIEYTDPNPFKQFHIGHLMSNAIGESLSRIIESQGAEVKRACYQGDVGPHVAKAIWGMRKKIQDSGFKIEEAGVGEWGEAYVFGAEKYETDEAAKKEIDALNKTIYEKTDPEINRIYDEGKKTSLVHFEEIYKILGTKFDHYFFESEMAPIGMFLVEEFLQKGIFEKSDLPAPRPGTFFVYVILCDDQSIYIGQTEDIQKRWRLHAGGKGAQYFKSHKPVQLIHYEEFGNRTDAIKREQDLKTGFGRKWLKREWEAGRTRQAGHAIIFPGEKYGLHTRVFVTSQRLPTYETKELGLNKRKHETYNFFKAMGFVYPTIANKTRHVSHGMMRFAFGKMSSRRGNVITGESLLSDIKKLVKEKIASRDFKDEEKSEVIDSVAVAALKFSILRQTAGADIVYDAEKSISFEGDSGPYLQYSYARAMSVIRKAKEMDLKAAAGSGNDALTELPRLLYRLPEVVERAEREYEPHYIVTYLVELAGAFNSFYAHHSILEGKDAAPWRLMVTTAFTVVMKNGLELLGIKAPERM